MVCELGREVLPGDDGSQGRGVWRAREALGSSCWEVLGFQGGVEEGSWEEGRGRFEGPNCALGH